MSSDLKSRLRIRPLARVTVAVLCLGPTAVAGQVPPPGQAQTNRSDFPKTIIDLQRDRRSQTIDLSAPGAATGEATLTNLAPAINAWFLLTLERGEGNGVAAYHLQNPQPDERRLELDPDGPHGIELRDGSEGQFCDLWSDASDALTEAQA